jgi:ADP-ribose pyrophosphatase
MESWKTLSRRVILDHSEFLTVEEHAVELPDGRVIPNWPWVIAPDYVNVVVVTEQGRFLFFRQVKYGLEGVCLAPVGGYLKPGEEPLLAARRELLEETGYEAANWIDLGSYQVDPNRGMATGHLFLALGAHRVADPDADDLEEQVLLHLTRSEVEAALMGGEFKVLAWAAIVALALRTMEE